MQKSTELKEPDERIRAYPIRTDKAKPLTAI
jgi:hypothetical protein